MDFSEKLNANDAPGASLIRAGGLIEVLGARGRFLAELIRDGKQIWQDDFENTVMTEGKNFAFDTFLAGAAYTVTGPYMGLISSVSFTAIAAADVGTQINGTNGWKEAGNANAPTYTAPRKTAAWNAASAGSKALSSALGFAITGTGTVKGAFLIYGSGALTTIDNAAANTKLWSAGLFSGGDRAVLSGDTLNISYSTSM